jgi:hypothetical protein
MSVFPQGLRSSVSDTVTDHVYTIRLPDIMEANEVRLGIDQSDTLSVESFVYSETSTILPRLVEYNWNTS